MGIKMINYLICGDGPGYGWSTLPLNQQHQAAPAAVHLTLNIALLGSSISSLLAQPTNQQHYNG
jgi:hypothetical protein